MKKVKIKIPAKINLTLDVAEVKEGFHEIKSLVCSIDIFDEITIKRRKDWDVNLKMRGIDAMCSVQQNNAYRAGKLFSDHFITEGVDITINKKIPVGAGLGGSSADVAGVLNGMKELFKVEEELDELANKLGSDCAYMLKGGWAVISGKGEKVKYNKLDKKLYLIIITEEQGVSSKEAYEKFDALKKKPKPCTDKVFKHLAENEFEKAFALAKNDLYPASLTFVQQMDFNVKALKKVGANLALMTGSGSSVVGVFLSEADRDKAYKTLKALFKGQILKANTLESGVK